MTNDDDGAGINSGHFVIAITAVGANVGVEADDFVLTLTIPLLDKIDVSLLIEIRPRRRSILFPNFLAKDMHGYRQHRQLRR